MFLRDAFLKVEVLIEYQVALHSAANWYDSHETVRETQHAKCLLLTLLCFWSFFLKAAHLTAHSTACSLPLMTPSVVYSIQCTVPCASTALVFIYVLRADSTGGGVQTWAEKRLHASQLLRFLPLTPWHASLREVAPPPFETAHALEIIARPFLNKMLISLAPVRSDKKKKKKKKKKLGLMNKPPTPTAHSSYSFSHCCLETTEAPKRLQTAFHTRKKVYEKHVCAMCISMGNESCMTNLENLMMDGIWMEFRIWMI